MKRFSDIILSGIFIAVSLPVQLLIFIILYVDLKEFPIFIQSRGLTLEKSRFRMIKFKTIKTLPTSISEHNAFLKPRLSKYISGFCKFLRVTGLDEIPQLYNVFSGKMSLVGPRPLMLADLKLIKKDFPAEYAERNSLKSKPGLTGLWQLFGNREEGITNLIELDKLYEINKSFFLDVKLLRFTFAAIIFRKNSDAIFFNEEKKVELSRKQIAVITNTAVKVKVNRDKDLHFLNLLKRKNDSYSIEIPEGYWTKDNTISSSEKKENFPKIVNINDKSKTA